MYCYFPLIRLVNFVKVAPVIAGSRTVTTMCSLYLLLKFLLVQFKYSVQHCVFIMLVYKLLAFIPHPIFFNISGYLLRTPVKSSSR